ncbi:MAG: divergent polysaccharide deacetylase family protein, partial [Stellaceae bacterium]
AVPAPAFNGEPRIAIVIDDLGLDKHRTARAIALDGRVTLSFLAYASDLPQQTAAARQAGHELIVHVPMEPIIRPSYLGRPAKTSSAFEQQEILRRLKWDLSRFKGYVGVDNRLGSELSRNQATAQTVMTALKRRGLLFLDARSGDAGTAFDVAERVGVPTVARDVFLDNDISSVSIEARLAALEKLAKTQGTAIAIGRPHDRTLDALTAWIATLKSKGIQLVPLTAIVKQRARRPVRVN